MQTCIRCFWLLGGIEPLGVVVNDKVRKKGNSKKKLKTQPPKNIGQLVDARFELATFPV